MAAQNIQIAEGGFLQRLKKRLVPYKQGETARLEAFLSAFPGEYCGWDADGSVAYSQGFAGKLELDRIRTLADIQTKLDPSDAAALEGMFNRLKNEHTPFTLVVADAADRQTFKISGTSGHSVSKNDTCQVLWLEDITAEKESYKAEQERTTAQHRELGRLRAALDHMPRPLWMRGADQTLIWVNQTYADFLKASPGEILNEQKEIQLTGRRKKQDPDIMPGPELAARALSENRILETYAHVINKGERLYMKFTEIPMPLHNATLGIAFDITRQEELTGELKRYKTSTQELLEQLRTAIAIFTGDQRLEFYNSAFSQLWGLEDGWLNRKPSLGDIMEKMRETRRLPEQTDFRRFKQSWLDMFTGLIDGHEDMLHLPDGSTLRMLVVPHSMGGLMMTFEDVTSRLELESSYNTLIAVQKETLDNLGEAVVVFGSDGRLKLSNPAFGRLWGLYPEDLEGEPHITRVVEKMKGFFEKPEWPQRKDELIAAGLDRIMHESRLDRTDDTLIDYSTVPLPDGGVLITYSDVTDTVRVENALREKNAALEEAERLKLDFLANVSYQLRTPLNAIMGFTEILDQEYFGALNERQKEYTHDIAEASEMLLGLINDILDLSTLEAGYMTLRRSEIKVRTLLDNILDLVKDWAGKENIQIKLSCPKNIGTVTADQLRMQQALINVIRNAINFTPSGGEIELSASRKKDGIYICVRDNGMGIDKEDRLRIFEPFERARSDGGGEGRLGKRPGAGLGLSLVKNIVALHGGRVELESERDKGTAVTIILPHNSIKTSLSLPIQ